MLPAGVLPFTLQTGRPAAGQQLLLPAAAATGSSINLGPGCYDACYALTEPQLARAVLPFKHMLGREGFPDGCSNPRNTAAVAGGGSVWGDVLDLDVAAAEAMIRRGAPMLVQMDRALGRGEGLVAGGGAHGFGALTSQLPLADDAMYAGVQRRVPQVDLEGGGIQRDGGRRGGRGGKGCSVLQSFTSCQGLDLRGTRGGEC